MMYWCRPLYGTRCSSHKTLHWVSCACKKLGCIVFYWAVMFMHRLDVWSCQECWRQPASGASASTVPQCGTACRLLCATTVFHWTRSRGSWRLICLDSNNAHHPAPLRRFVTGAVYKCHDLLSYLLYVCVVRIHWYIVEIAGDGN